MKAIPKIDIHAHAILWPELTVPYNAAGKRKLTTAELFEQYYGKLNVEQCVVLPMLSPEGVVSLIGHAVGGVCPFAVNEGVPVYLDESLRRFTTVFPACGSSNSAIELTIPELEQHSGCAGWVDVCKDWQQA